MTEMLESKGQERITYHTVKPDMTVGDFCQDSIEKIVESETPVHSYCVLHDGMIYYLDVVCAAIKPPYDRIEKSDPEVEPGTALWMGQRMN